MRIFKNRTMIGVLCILFSLFICFGLTPMFNRAVSQKTGIVRVTRDIRAGDRITAAMVTTAEVGGYNLPENVLRDKAAVVGQYAAADLSPGDYILNTKLSDSPASENAYLYNLNGEKQAISVTIKSFANGLSGKLQSGDVVSVIAPDYRKSGVTVVPAELRYVEVIGVTASSGYDANTGEAPDEEDERELPATVTLLAVPEQAAALAELEAEGRIHLALVYRGAPEQAAQFILAQQAVLDEMRAVAEDTAEEATGAENTAEEAAIVDSSATTGTNATATNSTNNPAATGGGGNSPAPSESEANADAP
jgi:pilus assembly protein CpaB